MTIDQKMSHSYGEIAGSEDRALLKSNPSAASGGCIAEEAASSRKVLKSPFILQTVRKRQTSGFGAAPRKVHVEQSR